MKVKFVNKKSIILCIECLLIIVCAVFSFDKINFPTVINDEFGYLGNAAYFAGYNWKSILSNVPYYSYGYSLLLTPLFILFNNGVNIYYGVYAINILSLMGSFLLINYILKEIFSDISWTLRSVISFIATINVYTFIMAGYAMAENVLFFSICLTFAFFIYFIKGPSILKGIILGSIISFSHLLHQRSLALVVAMLIMIVFLGIVKKTRKSVLIAVVISIVIGLVMQTEVKEILKNAIWNSDNVANGNDYAGVLGVIWELKSLDGIVNFIFSLISKVFAVTVSYFFMPLFFVEVCLKRLYELIKNKFVEINNKDILYIALFVTLICATGISALFALYPTRKDSVIYTRYIEYMLGPIMAIALCELTKIKFKKLRVFNYFIIMLLCCPIVNKALSWVLNDEFIEIASPVLATFYKENKLYIYISLLVMILIFVVIYSVFSSKKMWMKNTVIILIIVLSVLRGINIKTQWTDFDDIKRQTYQIGKQIENVIATENVEYEIAIVRGGIDYYTMHYYGGFIQQYLPKVKMEYIDKDEINSICTDARKLIVSDESTALNTELIDCEELYSNDRLCIFKSKGD
ncbi:hypothetical protein [Clostridium sp. D5]|uniref:hypothetical protein n=1 Tax=Clostridium sp. D5 TaxID=556261 RepID=UPI0011DDA2A2|nr:hypothetical protein [Clostridium sp. D5]